jgi:S-adenosylmethionine decarboxylase
MLTQTKRSIQWIVENKSLFSLNRKKYAGIHLIADFWGGKEIESEKELKVLLEKTVKAANANSLKSIVYKFNPQGITGVVLLAESHISIHTWPELNYAAIDIFTCGDKTHPDKALEFLKSELKPNKVIIKKIKRGGLNLKNK